LDVNDGGRLSQLALKPGVLTAQLGEFGSQRIGGLGSRTWPLVVQAGRATSKALAPLGELGGVQTVLTEQGAATRVAARVGVVLGNVYLYT
jgi:hypothetical protein